MYALAAGSIFMLPAKVSAQSDSIQTLPTVIVEASRINQNTKELGRNVTIIAGKDLSRFPVNSLDDLLKCMPSLEIQSRGSFGTQADITMRGSTFNQVLILLDGMRLNDPLTGHFNGYLPITSSEIAQIEIVRGAASALYGPDAVGGVINIVTKTFTQKQPQNNHDFQASIQRGEWNLWSISAGGYKKLGKFRVGGGLLSNASQGQPLEQPSVLRNDFDLKTYTLSAGYDISPKLSFMARAAFDRRDFNAQWYYTTSTIDQSRETTSRNWWQGKLRYAYNEKQQTELQYVNTYSTDFYAFNPDPRFVPSSHKMWFNNVQLTHTAQFSEHVKIAFGGQLDSRKIESNDRGNHQTQHWGAFGAMTTNTNFGLTATGSLRFDNDQSYGNEVTPQLNLSYVLNANLFLRAAIGKSIRAADFTERFVSNNLPGPLSAGRNIGLSGLKAERALNTEIGFDWNFTKGITFKTTGFLRDGSNLIDYVTLSGSEVIRQTGLTNLAAERSYRLAQNLFSVQTKGFEAELWLNKKIHKTNIDFMIGYTRLSSQNSQGIVSQYLANFAQHQINSNLFIKLSDRFTWTINGIYKKRDAAAVEAINRNLTATYSVFNTKAELSIIRNKCYVSAQVQNLFNVSYADILGAQMPKRWLMAGVKFCL